MNRVLDIVPGWYGVGTCLEAARSTFGTQAFADMYQRWLFFRTFVSNVEMTLAKTDLDDRTALRTARHRRRPRGVRRHPRREHARTVRIITEITGTGLVDHDPALQRTLEVRDPTLDPISYLQVSLLRRWRDKPR